MIQKLLLFTLPFLFSQTQNITFDANACLSHIKALSHQIGPRIEGREGERKAARYIAGKLQQYGYEVEQQPFPLPYGFHSQNVIGKRKGNFVWENVLVVGAHYDSKKPDSPGANDNASGVAVMLEAARQLRESLPYTIYFVAFGAEEMIDGNPEHHHYGSRYFVKALSGAQRKNIIGMINMDMVGYGGTYKIDYMHLASGWLAKHCILSAGTLGIKVSSSKARAFSDHEAFERAGIPVAYHHWVWDPAHHTSKDTYNRIVPSKLSATGKVVLLSLLTVESIDMH